MSDRVQASPREIQLADWRRRVAELYAAVRAHDEPASAWRLWREERDRLFACHPQSPLSHEQRGSFAALEYYPYDPNYRFEVDIAPCDVPPVKVAVGRDGTLRLVPSGQTRGLADRLGGELIVYWMAGYGGGLFLPFTDATSGALTYGGGRYVLDGIKGADLGMSEDGRRLILDFNFSYYPSCVHNNEWVCPLAPAGNRLPLAVTAGQRG
ncbi:MAG: DUF1684 domain-containing protein [Hyphomicrobiaceae bacterium]